VPAGFPTNQFFVNSDGSVWEYSQTAGTWVNTGTPYNVGQSATQLQTAAQQAAAAAAAQQATTTPTTATTPVSTTVVPSVTDTYSSIVAWLSQTDLLSSFGLNVPNGLVVLGAGLLVFFMTQSGGRGRR